MKLSGLTTKQANELLQENGLNMIPEAKTSLLQKILKKFISPISFMLLAASLLSLFGHRIFDFYFILFLLVLNNAISFWQENKADNAIKKLNQHLAANVKTLRDGKWTMVDSAKIVKGDVIQLATGDVIPADGKILDAKNVTANESTLTGESLPKDKSNGDAVYSGSFLATGIATIEISATGKNTYFGKTIFSVEKTLKKSLLEKDILTISRFLSILAIFSVVFFSAVFLLEKAPFVELLTIDLSLIIAGVPISLPTVMTLIIELGVIALAAKQVIVRRLSALEDLANVNLLLTDKTGTMTKNQITVQDILSYGGFTKRDVLKFSYLAGKENTRDLINHSIVEKAVSEKAQDTSIIVSEYTPADSVRKRTTVKFGLENHKAVICVGAPQIVASLCELNAETKKKFESDVEEFAKKGYRCIAVSINKENEKEEHMALVGLLTLSDILRDDARDVISFLKENNVRVVMLTGDNRAISREVSSELGLDGGHVLSRDELYRDGKTISPAVFLHTGAISEILPEDKYKLAETAKKTYTVAVTGDGVNDLPAIKEANVGIAVANAVDALKSTADIVLLSNGISVIKDALLESRKIFSRVYSYSIYRISESLRLIITILILGIVYRIYPLTPLQIILVALLNDIPIISLAFDNVKISRRPAKINVRERFVLSSLFGIVGVGNSIILFIIMVGYLHLPWHVIQTIYFLKLTISGHMLIYVAHTRQRWYKFLPSKEVIIATTATQLVATFFALTGFFMPGKVSFVYILMVWGWAFIWMQIGEAAKWVEQRFIESDL